MDKNMLCRTNIYQLFLRAFTDDGTFKAAEKHLGELAELGIDIVYLCPFFAEDDDPNPEHLSDRQKESGTGNPKNPYRIKDYFAVDEEYGTLDDLADFVRTAHGFGMKVIFDLVYYHCAPNAIFLKNNPDFVYRNEDGSIKYGEWRFPRLNFQNGALREYLFANMIYLVTAFDADGFRCDVGDSVPADFWKEGIRRCRAIKKDFFMLDEGGSLEYLKHGFDSLYYHNGSYDTVRMFYDIPKGTVSASDFASKLNKEKMSEICIWFFENHDSANDAFCERTDKKPAAGNALSVLAAFLKGIYFIYNGNETADSRRHSIFYNRFCESEPLTIDRKSAETYAGRKRYELVKQLIFLRHSLDAFEGDFDVEYADECLIKIVRTGKNSSAGALINLSEISADIPENICMDGETVISSGAGAGTLDGYGYIITKKQV